MLYQGSPLVGLCHEAIKGARPVRRTIAEPTREVARELSTGTGTSPDAAPGPEPAAGGEAPDATWGAERPPLPGVGRPVHAMAVPISLGREAPRSPRPPRSPRSPRSDDGGEAAGERRRGEVAAVLVVWERRPDPVAVARGQVPTQPYNATDEQILRTLAALAGHLLLQDEETTLTPTLTPTLTRLLQDEETTRLQRAHDEAAQRDRARKTQMQATPHLLPSTPLPSTYCLARIV